MVFDSRSISFQAVHAVISSQINGILDVIRDYPQAMMRLKDFQEIMSAYFIRQNEIFYEALSGCFRQKPLDFKMIEFLKKDLQDVKIDFLKFCEIYTIQANPIRIRNFPKDFLELSHKLKDRMDLEREYLFPLISKK